MKRRLQLLVVLLTSLFFGAVVLYRGRERWSEGLLRDSWRYSAPKRPTFSKVTDGVILPASNVSHHLEAILDTKSLSSQKINCPAVNVTRYAGLSRAPSNLSLDYFFALNLRQSLPLLPLLVGSIVAAIKILDPSRCALSIVEGHSPDGTADVLAALNSALKSLGVTYYFKSSGIDPSQGERIARLAQLRNMALEPLLSTSSTLKRHADTTVVFLNDVSICAEDILELVYQKKVSGADMTCAMDWTYAGRDPTFYDVWIARNMDGDSFFDIPSDGSWDSAWNMFWNADEETRNRFFEKRPFQVFSCWNGATAFAAGPLMNHGVRFRAANETAGECTQGEPQLFCKDLWFNGYRKIAVVPSVNLEYSVEKGRMIKEAKGFTSDNVLKQDPARDQIVWRVDPPEKVKCMPGDRQIIEFSYLPSFHDTVILLNQLYE